MTDELERISFADWLIELNEVARRFRYKGDSLTTQTGQLLWHAFYEAGISPTEALELAALETEEYAVDYSEI